LIAARRPGSTTINPAQREAQGETPGDQAAIAAAFPAAAKETQSTEAARKTMLHGGGKRRRWNDFVGTVEIGVDRHGVQGITGDRFSAVIPVGAAFNLSNFGQFRI